MTAKKTAKKAAKKAAKKTTKKATKKSATKAPRKTAKKSASKKQTAVKKTASKAPAERAKAAKQEAKSGFSSLAVNMGHVFALRPRVGTSFRPDDFRAAKQQLASESFKSAAEAARTVVKKTVELSRGDANPLQNKHHKRF
ncbi:MAG: hypothetical protein IH881_10565 [Myxococcales bacterium]|nr:hypothetical protein [Myxococcales bacterium]